MTTKSTETEPLAAPAPPSRRRNPTESKRRILDAAERAFALRGYEGARLRDIAQDAGVHHALLHHYYGDKRGLFREVVQRALTKVSTTGFAQLSATDDLNAATRSLVMGLVDFFSSHRDLLHIIEGAFRERGSEAQQLAASALREFIAPLLMRIRRRISDAQAHHFVRDDLDGEVMLVLGAGDAVRDSPRDHRGARDATADGGAAGSAQGAAVAIPRGGARTARDVRVSARRGAVSGGERVGERVLRA
jgi:AcrR family transcriptional regulator